MRCSDVYETLDGISRGSELRYKYVHDLIYLGLVKRVPRINDSTTELENLKKKLFEVKNAIKSLEDGRIRPQAGKSKSELLDQQIELRRSILDIVQNMRPSGVVKTSEGDVTLTYKGREVLQLLEARMPAASDLNWKTLEGNIKKLSERLSSEAKEASFILKKISPRLKKIDEFHLRSAAVGLASIDGDASRKARRFIDYTQDFEEIIESDDIFVVLGAEEAVSLEMQNKLKDRDIYADFLHLLPKLGYVNDLTPELRAIATLLISKPKEECNELLSRIRSETASIGSELGAALLLLESTDNSNFDILKDMYKSWLRKLKKASKGDINDAIFASALLATAAGDQKVIEDKFNQTQAHMKRLFNENMLAVSATIAIWPTNIEESFDNIRLAAAQILLKKLSVGGVENFSLGIKLLTNNADFINTGMGSTIGIAKDMQSAERIDTSGTMGQSAGAFTVALIASPLLLRAPFTVFHALTFQKYAVQDFKYHPVHTSYLYG